VQATTRSERGAGLAFLCRPAFLWTLVALGAALRIYQYASDTSFWFDELSLVRNIVHRSEAQLATEPLRYKQVAPVGFLVAEKAISRVLGESDLALRFLLLPAGLAALVLYLPLARRTLDGYALPFAVAAFAIATPMIRYTAELKQYGIDILAAVGLSLATLRLRDADATARRCVVAGLVGAGLVWLSQATILIVAGLGGALLLEWLFSRRDAPTGRAVKITVPIWAAASLAATLLAFHLVTPETRQFMDRFWRMRGGFPPWPIHQATDLLWLWDRVVQLFTDDMMLRYRWPVLYGVLAMGGYVVLWRRRRFAALVLLGPLAAAAFAALAQQYPFRTRLVVYLVPALLLAVAEGAESVRRLLARIHPAAGAVAMAVLFVGPVESSVRWPPPYFIEDHKTVLAFVREHRRPGDAVFVYGYELEALERYGAAYGLGPDDYTIGGCHADDRREYLREVDRFRGAPRVWLIAGAVPPFQPPREIIDAYLSTIGVRRDHIEVPSARPLFPVSATLFDLSDPGRLTAATAETFNVERQYPPGDNRAFPILCGEWVQPLKP
jgi:hypothetical protein